MICVECLLSSFTVILEIVFCTVYLDMFVCVVSVLNAKERNLCSIFDIGSVFCSVDLLGVLKWRLEPQKLESNLRALMKVGGEETVKVNS